MRDPEPPAPGSKTALERRLSPVADVHRGRAGGVLLMALTMLLLLMSAYYMLKTARESLILTRGGAEVKTCGG
jgi:ATP/ADP translocase